MELADIVFDQVRCCLRYRKQADGHIHKEECYDCDREASRIVEEFLARIPEVRKLLAGDVQAAFEGDPAATSTDETLFSYPGIFAIMVQRLAHEFHRVGVPLLPRIMTEYAHNVTGIDIHPGAELGERLFIDHGTGVVIGETTKIGRNVKIYQGVTLGALAPGYGQMLRGRSAIRPSRTTSPFTLAPPSSAARRLSAKAPRSEATSSSPAACQRTIR